MDAMNLRSSLYALLTVICLTGCDSVASLLPKKDADLVYALGPREGFSSPLQSPLKPAYPALEFHGHAYGLNSAQGKTLQTVAEAWTDKKPKYLIAGYTAPGLPDDYARALSERRAQAVRQRLIENGIEAANLQTVGFGHDASPSGPSSDVVVIYQQP